MRAQIYPAVMLTILLTILTGLFYPLVITGLAQVLFPHQANGSLVVEGGRVVGSHLIGQPFDDPKYFWGRLSATSPYPYNAAASSGSNLAPTNQALIDAVKQRVAALRAADPGNAAPVPADLATASGSGLDPHIRGHGAPVRPAAHGGTAVWHPRRTPRQCAGAQPGAGPSKVTAAWSRSPAGWAHECARVESDTGTRQVRSGFRHRRADTSTSRGVAGARRDRRAPP